MVKAREVKSNKGSEGSAPFIKFGNADIIYLKHWEKF